MPRRSARSEEPRRSPESKGAARTSRACGRSASGAKISSRCPTSARGGYWQGTENARPLTSASSPRKARPVSSPQAFRGLGANQHVAGQPNDVRVEHHHHGYPKHSKATRGAHHDHLHPAHMTDRVDQVMTVSRNEFSSYDSAAPRHGYARTPFGGYISGIYSDAGSETSASGSARLHDVAVQRGLERDKSREWFHNPEASPRPYHVGFTLECRPENGYGRCVYGGYQLRDVPDPMKPKDYHHSYRQVPAHIREIPEPDRPGPGFARTAMGGYFRR